MQLCIGILECDHVDEDLLNIQGEYSDMFSDLFYSQVDNLEFELDVEVAVYDLTANHFPISLDSCDAYLITGSRFGVNDVAEIPWLQKAKDLVVELYQSKIPTIGICFGHQLLADSLGGKVEKTEDKGWGVGVHSWEIKNQKNWMGVSENILSEFSLLASHQDQVVLLPPNASLIASSKFCPIAGFQIEDTILSFQGHPEFSTEYLSTLIDRRLIQIGEATTTVAKASLNNNVDDELVGQWMLNFLSQKTVTNN